ncbi:MAG: hypothetical protein JWN98_784, partial [Abditibacteriota bacterium]|nr:hypothetical protein [Abditibacteriota bacterium]
MIASRQLRFGFTALTVALTSDLALTAMLAAPIAHAQTPSATAAPRTVAPRTQAPRTTATPVPTEGADPDATPTAQPPVPLAASTLDEYRGRLRRAEAKLRAMQGSTPRDLPKVLLPIAKSFRIQRADGERQTAGGDEWQRRIDDWIDTQSRSQLRRTGSRREQVNSARVAIAARLRELDRWTTQRNGKYFAPATNAQNIMGQLEASGEIRSGPTSLQLWWARIARWTSDSFEAFVKWVGRLFPSPPSGNVRPANIDPQLLKALFALAVVALLAVIGFLVWRAVGGRWSLNPTRREMRFEGEEADLLQ